DTTAAVTPPIKPPARPPIIVAPRLVPRRTAWLHRGHWYAIRTSGKWGRRHVRGTAAAPVRRSLACFPGPRGRGGPGTPPWHTPFARSAPARPCCYTPPRQRPV